MVEILSPAGNMICLKAAVENGADAVYLGLAAFNARNSADNFDESNIKEAVDYAHAKSVKVYLTLNTLVDNDDITTCLRTAAVAAKAGVDAFIVQDIGMAGLFLRYFPDVPLHASTQLSIDTTDGVQEALKSGFARVVLARELSIGEITDIYRQTGAELEVFVHGALCMGFSGQCLLSERIGGRSGNRGMCAQPCRMCYENEATREKAYFLSPKDLCTVEILPGLLKAGVSSLKIEGRMKGPEYVAAVTRVYRKYVDLALACQNDSTLEYKVEAEDMQMLQQVFNRGGFTKGFPGDDSIKEMMSVDVPKNLGVLIGEVVKSTGTVRSGNSNAMNIGRSAGAEGNKVKVRLSSDLDMGDGVELDMPGRPGGIVSIIRSRGQNVKHAGVGELVTVGNIKNIEGVRPGTKVYRTSSKVLNKQLAESYEKESAISAGELPVKMYCKINVGEHAELRMSLLKDNEQLNEVVVESESIAEPAKTPLTSAESVFDRLRKTGDYPFVVTEIEGDIDLQAYLPAKELNSMRRRACDELLDKWKVGGRREVAEDFTSTEYVAELDAKEAERVFNKPICILLDHRDGMGLVEAVREKSADELIALPIAAFENRRIAAFDNDCKDDVCINKQFAESDMVNVAVWCPPGVRGKVARGLLESSLDSAFAAGVRTVLINSLNELKLAKSVVEKYGGDGTVVAGTGCNAVNFESIKRLLDMGFDYVVPSSEWYDIKKELPKYRGGVKSKPADGTDADAVMFVNICPAGYSIDCKRNIERGGRCPFDGGAESEERAGGAKRNQLVFSNKFGDRLEVIPGICGCYSMVCLHRK